MSDNPYDVSSSILKDNHGLFIGDSHGELSIPEWLKQHLDDFQREGVEQLHMEMVRSDHQFLIDNYYADVEGSGIRLEAYLEKRWGHKSPGTGAAYFDIIETAKNNGIKVFGIDNDITGDNRLEGSNPHWASTINSKMTELSPNGKFLVFGGTGHSANYPLNKGVDQILGNIPSIDFDQSKSKNVEIRKADGRESDYIVSLPDSPNQREYGQEPAEQYKFDMPKDIDLPSMGTIIVPSDRLLPKIMPEAPQLPSKDIESIKKIMETFKEQTSSIQTEGLPPSTRNKAIYRS